MLALDPISLIFLGCALFSALFLGVSVFLGGGHSHTGHIGHTGHVGHIASHAGHAASHVNGHATHTANSAAQATVEASGPPAIWSAAQSALMGALNLNGALVFLLLFGALGYLLRNTATALPYIILLSAAVGVAGAVVVNTALARLFFENEAGVLTTGSSHVEGRIGTVSIAIRPGGVGEVIFTGEAGARQSLGARAEDATAAIAIDTEVVITSVTNGIATVQPWESLLDEAKRRLLADPARGQTPPAP